MVGQMAQSSTVMMTEIAKPKTHKAMRCDGSTCKNLKIFGGDAKDWEEFAVKFKGHIAADDLKGTRGLGPHRSEDVGGRVGG